ncbi:concanavalin A-like lectin/glucanase, partial [Rozella allomycis CSF55]
MWVTNIRISDKDSDSESKFWDYGGNTVISTYSYARLTPDVPSKAGYIVSKTVCSCNTLHGNPSRRVHGDGFAFWFTEKQANERGDAFGGPGKFNGLGHSFPYVSGMVNDGNRVFNHANDGSGSINGGCE